MKNKKKRSEEIPETLIEWSARLKQYSNELPMNPLPVAPLDNEARLREIIGREGLRLRLDLIIHEAHCVAPCRCACRALVLSWERRKWVRRIVRLPK